MKSFLKSPYKNNQKFTSDFLLNGYDLNITATTKNRGIYFGSVAKNSTYSGSSLTSTIRGLENADAELTSDIVIKGINLGNGISVEAGYQEATIVNAGFSAINTISISDYENGIAIGTSSPKAQVSLQISNVNELTIAGTDKNSMRRGFLSFGDKSSMNIETKRLIKADLKGLSECPSCKGDTSQNLRSNIVAGNGTISLKSTTVDFAGNTTADILTETNAQNIYDRSWGIQATAVPDEPENCTISRAQTNANSTITVQGTDLLSMATNWGGVSAESNQDYFAKVTLVGQNISLTSAGATANSEKQTGFDDIHAGIRAVSFNHDTKSFKDNKEASVTVNGGTVSLAYNKDGDLNKAEKQHDMIYAKGSSAKVVVNASDSLAINAEKHDVRNLAYADEGGWIELNTGTGATAQNFKAGKTVANGNLTARNGGKVDTYLAAGSTLEGAAFDNSFVTYSSAAGGYAHATNAGEVNLAGEGGALWTVKQYEARGVGFGGIQPTVSTIKTLTANESSTHANPFVVDLTKETAVQKLNVGTLGGTGSAQFNLRLNVNGDGTVAGNDRVLFEKVSGEHGLFVTVDKHDIVVPEKLNANWLAMVHTPEQGKFVLANEGGVDIGGFKYTLANETNTSVVGGDQKSQYWYLERTNEHSDAGATAIEIAGNQRFLHWADLQDLRKRLGEVRYGAQDGAWARVTAQKDKADGAQGTEGMEQEYYGVNVGFDRLVNPSEERTWLVGGSFTYGQADQDTRRTNAGSGETDRYGFNLYATWAHANGSYADFVFSGDWYDQNVTTRANGVEQKGSYDTWGAGLSVEIGHMFSSERSDMSWGPWYRHFWIEPQLQLAYYRLNGTDYQLSNNGIRVNLDDDDSLIGRAGVVLGSRWNYGSNYNSIDQRYVQVQLKGGVKHDFLGDYSLTMNDLEVTKDIGATTFYYGVGADWQLSDNARVYVNVERESGDDYTKEYEANIGVKVNFN